MKSLSSQIQIATTNHRGRTVFTYEHEYYEKKYGWEAKAFIAHCISQWGDEFEHTLDYWEEGHNPIELEVVDYWGSTFVERFSKELPRCDADWYRDVFRAKLRSLVLPRKVIEGYFEKIGYDADEEYAERYFERCNAYFGTDIKLLPGDWLRIGLSDDDGNLRLSDDILRFAGDMDIEILVKTISWILSGFTKYFDIYNIDIKGYITINTSLCKTLSKNYPEFFGKGKLGSKWFEDVYRAKLLSIRIPERLLFCTK